MNRPLAKSIAAYAEACRLIPGGVNSPVRAFRSVGGTPIYFRRARGGRFWDLDGNEYIDFCLSWGPLILGHAFPRVVQAVQRAAEDGLSYGACHERELASSPRYPLISTPRWSRSGSLIQGRKR